MITIRPKFDYSALSGTLLATSEYYASEDGRKIIVSATHWPVRTKDGSIDLRFNPLSRTWTLPEFCEVLARAKALGDYQDWQTGEKDEPALEHLRAFAQVSEPRVSREGFHLNTGGLYCDIWPHAPLYRWKTFRAFADACDCFDNLNRATKKPA